MRTQLRRFAGLAALWRKLVPAAMMILTGSELMAQVVANRVFTEPSGAVFYVDGTPYRSPQVFLWQTGTSHVLRIDAAQTEPSNTSRYTATAWVDLTGTFKSTGTTATITANSTITEYKSQVSQQYRVDLFLFNLPAEVINGLSLNCGNPGKPPLVQGQSGLQLPGVAIVGGTCFAWSQTLWAGSGANLALEAYPYPGFVFQGWSVNAKSNAFISSVMITGPTSLFPRFAPGKHVVFYTDPPQLQVRVDGTVVNTPLMDANVRTTESGAFDFGDGQNIVLGAPSPQRDLQGTPWVFDSFDIGGGQNTVYKVKDVNVPATITARFKKGISFSLGTNPANLKLNVDGRDNWPSQDFLWAVGSKHTIAAPALVTDTRGRKYQFTGWAHGGDASQDLTLPNEVPSAGGIRWTANYQLLPRLTVSMVQAGIHLQIDGVDCAAPCSVDKPSGSDVSIAAQATIPTGDSTRLEFQGWNDSVAQPVRVVRLAADDIRIGASYRTMNRLMALADPAEGAEFAISPPSGDGFYSSDTQVTITVNPLKGFRFRRWEGDLQGTFRTASVSMFGPRIVRAGLDRSAFVVEAGVKNAAGDTPVGAVAAGSLISIYGDGLSTETIVGGVNPMPQALAGITIRWNGRLLPLIFVSPQQINAFLPAEAEPGDHTLYVRLANQQEVSSNFKVVRNAPGLFAFFVDSKGYAVAAHENGKPITPDSPAKRGETITLFGTGFAPLLRPVPEGFTVPEGIVYGVSDKAELMAGDLVVPADSSFAASGLIGTIASKYRLGSQFPAGGGIPVKVRVNDQESNTVLLPVE